MKSHKSKNRKVSVFFVFFGILLIVYTVSLFLPLIWGVFASFKSSGEFSSDSLGFPKSWHVSNYLTAYRYFFVLVQSGMTNRYVYIEEMFLNSILYAGGCAFASTFVACITAYATAKYKEYVFSKILYGVVVITMILPVVGNFPSELQILRTLGLYDNIAGPWLLKANFLGMYYLVFYGVFANFAKDFSEAAMLDGASQVRILFTIMLPLVSNIMLTVFLINFVAFWNDYQTPYLYLPNHPTLAYGLFMYSSYTIKEISSTPFKLAGCMIVFVPVFCVFMCFQKRLMGNISMGGIKE